MNMLKAFVFSALATALAAPAAAQTVGIGTNPQGSLYYRVGATVAKLMSDHLDIRARVQPFSGSSTYIPLLNNNEIQLGIINVSDAVKARKGVDAFEGRPQPNIQLLNVMFPLPFTLLVPADSPIKSISEVKGLRLPTAFTSQTTINDLQEAILANAGLTPDDIRGYPVPNVFTGAEAVGDGRVDAATTAVGIAAIQKSNLKLRSRGGVRFVSIDTSPEAVARMSAVVPSRPLVIHPAPHLTGIVEPTATMAFLAFLAANDRMSEDEAYRLVKLLHASKEEMAKSAPPLQNFDPDAMTFKLDAEYHPGAIRFYREIGQWPPQ